MSFLSKAARCFNVVCLLGLITTFTILSILLFYPFPNPEDSIKQWPLKTFEDYNKHWQPIMAESQVHLQMPPLLATASKHRLSNGIELNVWEGGRSNDPNQKLLVFLHGYPESALLCWGRYLDHFIKKGYWVMAPDMRGYNASSKPPFSSGASFKDEMKEVEKLKQSPSTWRQYMNKLNEISDHYVDRSIAADFKLLVTEYAKRDKAIFITHDWGSGAILYILNEYPDVVEKVVLGTAPSRNFKKFFNEQPMNVLRQFLKSWYIFFFQLTGLSDHIFTRQNFGFLYLFSGLEDLGRQGRISAEEGLMSMKNIRDSFTTASSYYRGAFKPRLRGRVFVDDIDCPILFTHAENDRFLSEPPLQFALREALTPKAKERSKVVTFADTPHWIEYFGEVVIPVIEKFIKEE